MKFRYVLPVVFTSSNLQKYTYICTRRVKFLGRAKKIAKMPFQQTHGVRVQRRLVSVCERTYASQVFSHNEKN